jgi:hypothetical protein
MRLSLIGVGTLLAAALVQVQPGHAERAPTPWCMQPSIFSDGDLDCSYYTEGQCRASLSGMSGYCIQNPWLSRPREEWLKWTNQRPEPKRKARKRRQSN